jgi:hypothetical protein
MERPHASGAGVFEIRFYLTEPGKGHPHGLAERLSPETDQ